MPAANGECGRSRGECAASKARGTQDVAPAGYLLLRPKLCLEQSDCSPPPARQCRYYLVAYPSQIQGHRKRLWQLHSAGQNSRILSQIVPLAKRNHDDQRRKPPSFGTRRSEKRSPSASARRFLDGRYREFPSGNHAQSKPLSYIVLGLPNARQRAKRGIPEHVHPDSPFSHESGLEDRGRILNLLLLFLRYDTRRCRYFVDGASVSGQFLSARNILFDAVGAKSIYVRER
jgi:hypothetical protein